MQNKGGYFSLELPPRYFCLFCCCGFFLHQNPDHLQRVHTSCITNKAKLWLTVVCKGCTQKSIQPYNVIQHRIWFHISDHKLGTLLHSNWAIKSKLLQCFVSALVPRYDSLNCKQKEDCKIYSSILIHTKVLPSQIFIGQVHCSLD